MKKSLWVPAFAGMTLLVAVAAYAWMGDISGSPAPVSGASAAVAAPLKSYSIPPLGGHSL